MACLIQLSPSMDKLIKKNTYTITMKNKNKILNRIFLLNNGLQTKTLKILIIIIVVSVIIWLINMSLSLKISSIVMNNIMNLLLKHLKIKENLIISLPKLLKN